MCFCHFYIFYYKLKTTKISTNEKQNKYYFGKIILSYFNNLLKYKKIL